jgi:hypothetical protein
MRSAWRAKDKKKDPVKRRYDKKDRIKRRCDKKI